MNTSQSESINALIQRFLSARSQLDIFVEQVHKLFRRTEFSTNTFESATITDNYEKIQLLESIASTLNTESVETEEHLDAACEQIAMVLSRIKDLPRTTHNRYCV
ncbi:hypothetical protein ACFX2I_021731 [Malus domestica]